jgi:hypothetical protein
MMQPRPRADFAEDDPGQPDNSVQTLPARIRMIRSRTLKRCFIAVAFLLTASSGLRADSITADFTSGPTITIHSNQLVSWTNWWGLMNVSAGPINVVNHTQGDVAFQAFCVDLLTQVGSAPQDLTATVYSPLSSIGKDTMPGFSNSSYSDVGNRLSYLMDLWHASGSGWSSNTLAGLQAAIWHVIDGTFELEAASSTTTSAYTYFMKLVGDAGHDGNTVNKTGWKTYSAYDKDITYSGGQLLWMDPQHSYQNLITYSDVPATPQADPVPEPGTLATAFVGSLLCLGYARRKQVFRRVD